MLYFSLLVGCDRTSKTVRIDGSSTVFPVSAAVLEDYIRSDQPVVKVTVGYSGTGGGMKMLAHGEIDICDASRRIKEIEIEKCKDAGIEVIEFVVAFDGISIVTNLGNKWCDSITVGQLKTIWQPDSKGVVTKWSDVDADWPDEPLKLYGPGPDSGTFDYFTKAIVGTEKASRSDYTANENDNALIRGVEADKGTLCYFGYAYYAENKDKLKLLGVDNGNGPISPDESTVRDGSYAPLSRPLYIYVRKDSLERQEVVTFLRYYLDNVGRLANRVGYVRVSDEVEQENQASFTSALSESSGS